MNLFDKILKSDYVKKPEKLLTKPRVDPDYIQLTTLQMLQLFFINKLILGKNGAEEYAKVVERNAKKRHEQHQDSDPLTNKQPESIKAYNLAIVLDGEVMDVIRAQETLADILLASPTFVVFNSSETSVKVGGTYKEGKFYDESGKELTRNSTTI